MNEKEIEAQCTDIVRKLTPHLAGYDPMLAACAAVSLGGMISSRELPFAQYIKLCVKSYNYLSEKAIENEL
jgi:hypothetical protein